MAQIHERMQPNQRVEPTAFGGGSRANPLGEMTTTLNPQGIKGTWKSGIVSDWHTIDSVCVGENEFGHPIFETTRSEIGELMYRFKYRNDAEALKQLFSIACKANL